MREPIAERAFDDGNLMTPYCAARPRNADIAAMDAPNPSATPTFASRTPLHVGAVGLKVRDLDRLTGFYRDVLGLAVLDRTIRTAPRSAPAACPSSISSTGPRPSPTTPDRRPLSHRVPDADARRPRALDPAMARNRACRSPAPPTTAVSEAFYLDDPEGNGIEVYRDRPTESWEWTARFEDDHRPARHRGDLARVAATRRLPRRAGRTAHRPRPPAGRRRRAARRSSIATRSGSTSPAAATAPPSCRRAAITTTSRGNVWHSAGAGTRDEDRAGLGVALARSRRCGGLRSGRTRLAQAGVRLRRAPTGIETADPWGTQVRIERA